MSDKNLLTKSLLIVLLLALAAWTLYPPSEKLKGGIDLVGGHSLLYEIDTAGLDNTDQLAERVMAVLKDRVDPQGQRNLEWRPIGHNRLEIRMPRPSRKAKERRDAFDVVMNQIRAMNIGRSDLSSALAKSGEDRKQALDALTRGVTSRQPLVEAVANSYDTWSAAKQTGDPKLIEPAEETFEAARDELFLTNIDVQMLSDLLAMGPGREREKELERLKARQPERASLIDEAAVKHDAWAEDKGTLEDPADLQRLLRGAGVLEFRLVAEKNSETAGATILATEEYLREPVAKYTEQLARRGPRPQPGDRYVWLRIADPVGFLSLDDRTALDNWDLVKAGTRLVVEKYANQYYALAHDTPRNTMLHTREGARSWSLKAAGVTRDQRGRPAVNFRFDARGGQLFYELTAPNVNRQLGIFLDDQAVSSANIGEAIRQEGQITGEFSMDRVIEIVNKLEAGSLPARLKEEPLMIKSIGPSLGQQNIQSGLRSAIWGTCAVIVCVGIYYLFAGVVANVAVLMNLLLVLATMAFLEATLTLPGIAGLILTVGMSVDANVLIFERMREEFDRGASIRTAIKNGYDRAFSAILDSNLTTIISCIILGYVGTEEIKGYALTLGFGVATSLFTAIVVTRVIFTGLVQIGWLKTLPMLSIPGMKNANFDWMRLWRYFWPVSAVLLIGGFVAFDAQPKQNLYDIEFLGGTSAQLELKKGVELNDDEVRRHITSKDPDGAAGWLLSAADRIEQAEVTPSGDSGLVYVRADGLTPEQVETFVSMLVLSPIVQNAGTSVEGDRVRVLLNQDANATAATLKERLPDAAAYARKSSEWLASAKVQFVGDAGDVPGAGKAFEVVTVETDRKLVRDAIVAALGDRLRVDRAVQFAAIAGPDDAERVLPIPPTASLLSDVIDGTSTYDVQNFRDGVAIVLDDLSPPQSEAEVKTRLRDIRLQPDFEKFGWRANEVVGLTPSGAGGSDEPTFTRMAVLVMDNNIPFSEDAASWKAHLVAPELDLIKAALTTERSLQKVLVFQPSVAAQAKQQALAAIILACIAMAAYLWFRFGALDYGLAAIVALLHDVSIAVGAVALSYYISQTFFGPLFMIEDFRIDLAMVAAFLTVLGYSVNDTIVVFDRIRENRGKLKTLSPELVNRSINQTLARTLLTGVTTLIVVSVMYVMGGPGIHGFNFVLLVGILVGTYSSIAIASPLLLNRHLLRAAIYAVLAMSLFGLGLTLPSTAWKAIVCVGALAGGGLAIWREIRRSGEDRRRTALAAA